MPRQAQSARRRAAADDVSPVQAFSIQQFCQTHSISPSLFYKLQTLGRGPATMRIGGRTLISVEAAAKWRRKVEREAVSTT